MNIRNLEQIRAKHALTFWANPPSDVRGEGGGDVVRGLPALIVNNGLLATLAFSKAKGGGHENLMKEIGRYLSVSTPEGPGILKGGSTLDTFIGELTKGDSTLLRLATTEALAYLAYLKRFAPKGD
jgi:CRISPR type III-B/RAMP module-associated protein Cmr5